MEKESFISALKEKSQVDNLSARTIDEVAAMFLPLFADDTKVTEESWKMPVQMLKTMSGQLRHDTSEGINSFKTKFEADNKTAQQKAIEDAIAKAKAEWEKANPKPQQEEKPAETNDVDQKIADAIAKAMEKMTNEESAFGKLNKQFSDYMAQVAAEKKAKSIESMRGDILEYIMEFDGLDADDNIIENVMFKLKIDGEKTLDALKTEAKSLYEAAYKKDVAKNGGGKPFKGGSGDGGDGEQGAAAWIKSRSGMAEQEAASAEARKKLLK